MRTPPLLADFSHARACKPFCENSLTLPHRPEGRIFRAVNIQIDLALHKSLEPQWFQGISFLRVAQIEGAILRNGARGAELVVPAR